jgi:putative transposase
MPRLPRLFVPGGYYHVILRGNHREPLFGCPADRQVLNDIVEDAIDRYGARIHAFCWMTNHLHALIQISDRPLGRVVQTIAQRYSRYRHQRLHTCGHLFERRHRAKLIDVDAYFLTVLRYIHLNPVKARLVDDPANYPWSSHRAFIGKETIPWLTTTFALSLFSNHLAHARAAYRRFMLEKVDDDEEDLAGKLHPEDSRILGSDEFVTNIRTIPRPPPSSLSLEELAEEVCSEHGASVALLTSSRRSRSITLIRVELTRRALDQHVATLCEVARFLCRHPSSLGRLLERYGGGR